MMKSHAIHRDAFTTCLVLVRGCLNAALGLVAMGTEKSTNKKMMYDVGGRPAGEQGAQPECVCVRMCESGKVVIDTKCNSFDVH